MTNADNAATRLGDLSAILMAQYFPDFLPTVYKFGGITNRIINPATRIIHGDGENIKFKTKNGDTIRSTRDPLSDFAAPRAYGATQIKARFSENSSLNDFMSMSGSAQISALDLMEGPAAAVVDHAMEVYEDMRDDYAEKLAIKRNTPASGLLALVNGADVQNDSNVYASCTADPSATAEARILIDNGSVAYFQPGRRLDFWDPTNSVWSLRSVLVTDYNPVDDSVGLALDADSSASVFGTALADNDEIYFSGEKGAGMFSVGEFFETPASGDSYIGGVDRTSSSYRFLLPTRTRSGSTARTIAKGDLNDLATAMQFVTEDDLVVVVASNPRINQTLRDAIGEDVFIPFPTTGKTKRYAHIGAVGVTYQHPMFGVTVLAADPLISPDCVRVTVANDWVGECYNTKDLEFMPSGDGPGNWYRMESDTPGNGKSKFYKADVWHPGMLDWCKAPRRQGHIANVTA